MTSATTTPLAASAHDHFFLGTDHQRKWIALAQNFSRLPAHEQATLQQRMTEWARLSPTSASGAWSIIPARESPPW